MILTKIAGKFLADWLTPVSPEQDEKALTLIAKINVVAAGTAMPFVLIGIKADTVLLGVAMLIAQPQLIGLNLANTIAVAGKKRAGHDILLKEYLIALFSAVLMYINLFILIGHFVRSVN